MKFGKKNPSVQFFYISQNKKFSYYVVLKEKRRFLFYCSIKKIENRAHKFLNNKIVIFASIQNAAIDE